MIIYIYIYVHIYIHIYSKYIQCIARNIGNSELLKLYPIL